MITIPTRYIDEQAKELRYIYKDDACVDLTACETTTIFPGRWAKIGAGVQLAIPDTHVGLVCPRSGLALHHGVTVLNAPGVIDSGYRGEVGVLLINHHKTQQFDVKLGTRIAQLLIIPRETVLFPSALHLSNEDEGRGAGGFGSTGGI